MVPAIFITLESLPLTPTGKVDRRSLPPPQGTRPPLENPYVAPSSPLEETLVKIWADVLRLEQVGVNDHFLELGGNSLLATILVSRVLKTLHVQVPLRTLFEAPTVAEMATVIIETLARGIGKEKLDRMFEEVLSQEDLPSSLSTGPVGRVPVMRSGISADLYQALHHAVSSNTGSSSSVKTRSCEV